MAVITAIIGAVFCSIIVESFLGKKRKNDSWSSLLAAIHIP
jgi:hypothetical protein